MKNILMVAFFLFVYFNKSFAQKRVIVLGLDGISSEAFKEAKHPNIDRLFEKGMVSLTTRPVMPSVTLPNWTSHFTGSGPEEHGVTSNNWTVDSKVLLPLETDNKGYFPSIFKVLKENIPNINIGFYYNWAELINSFNQEYLDEVSFEKEDGYIQNYSKALKFVQKHKTPTLIFLYSVHTDHVGHSKGWMSPEYIKSIEEADQSIGRFIDDLKETKLYENTHFMLITDHGGIEKGHGGVTMNEMQVPWAISGPMIQKISDINFFNSNKNTALYLAKIYGIKSSKIPSSWTGTYHANIFNR